MEAPESKTTDRTPRKDARSPTSTLPRHIALVNADDRGSRTATSFILDDFEEAFDVYARHNADPDTPIPGIVRFDLNRIGIADARSLIRFDTIILGYALCNDNLLDYAGDRLHPLLEKGCLSENAHLYAIASTNDRAPERVISSFAALEAICSGHQLKWGGGLAASASDMIPLTAEMPRMGMMRRRLSEATDKLILAVRCGADAGTITIPAPAPHFLCRLIAHKWTKSNRP